MSGTAAPATGQRVIALIRRFPATAAALLIAGALSLGTAHASPAPSLPDAADPAFAPIDVPESAPPAAAGYADRAQDLIDRGMDYLGIRYRRGGSSPDTGLDCSGLVQNVFRNALGLDLPRTAREMARLGNTIGYQELKPGDLVFFNTMRRAFSHVGIYVGEGRFLHAPASGGEVRIEELGKRYWTQRFNGARRLLPEADAGASASD